MSKSMMHHLNFGKCGWTNHYEQIIAEPQVTAFLAVRKFVPEERTAVAAYFEWSFTLCPQTFALKIRLFSVKQTFYFPLRRRETMTRIHSSRHSSFCREVFLVITLGTRQLDPKGFRMNILAVLEASLWSDTTHVASFPKLMMSRKGW